MCKTASLKESIAIVFAGKELFNTLEVLISSCPKLFHITNHVLYACMFNSLKSMSVLLLYKLYTIQLYCIMYNLYTYGI